MNTHHFVVTGIGLALLTGGCATNPSFDSQQARRRFEVSPLGSSEPDSDVTISRPAMQLAGIGSPGDVGRKVKTAKQRLQEATPSDSIPQDAPATPDASAAPAAPLPPPVPAPANVQSLYTDPFLLSTGAGVRPRAVPAPVRQFSVPAPGGDEARVPVDAGTSVANQATQIHSPPAPVTPPAAPITVSDRITASNPDLPSPPADIGATAVADADPLVHRFAQRMRDYPSDVSAHLDYQMLHLLHDEPVPQLDEISTLPGEDRELLTAVMDGLSNFRSGLRANRNMLLSEKVKPILDMADRVRSEAELTIPIIAICSRVQGFGVYDPMPTTLRAGVENPVIIYCEVGNFASQQDDKGMWETKLSQEAVLYTDTGYPAWRDKSVMPPDLSRNRRHDFFVVKKVTLPRTLSVGRYNLKVSIFDEQVKRVAENSVPIELMAQ